MRTIELTTPATKLLLRGINLKLTAAMRTVFAAKAERLFRHEPRIVRLRLDLADESRGGIPRFTAKGHVEIGGPDLRAAVTTDDAYKSVDLLIDRLDRALRKRMTALTTRRHVDDIRLHAALLDPKLADLRAAG